jgi:hypothetical protein
MKNISLFLGKVLKVKVIRDKSRVMNSEESSFPGFTFTRKRLTVSEKSIKRFKSELRRLGKRVSSKAGAYFYTFTVDWDSLSG